MTHPAWYHREIYAEDSGPDVSVVQRKLGTTSTGHMNAETVARVRGFQRVHALPITGLIDLDTARALGESATYGLAPVWLGPPIDYVGLRKALHLSPWEDLEAAIRRFQSSRNHYPTGELTDQLALEIGDTS